MVPRMVGITPRVVPLSSRQGPLSPTLRVQEGALHELADHDNVTVVRGDAQAQVHHGW